MPGKCFAATKILGKFATGAHLLLFLNIYKGNLDDSVASDIHYNSNHAQFWGSVEYQGMSWSTLRDSKGRCL